MLKNAPRSAAKKEYFLHSFDYDKTINYKGFTMNPYFLYLSYLIYAQFDGATGKPEYLHGSCIGFKSGATLPFCNRMAAQKGLSEVEVQKAVDYFGATPFRWFVYEDDHEQIKLLESMGFTLSAQFPAMIADLATMNEVDYGPDIKVEEMPLTPSNIQAWVGLVAASYKSDAVQFHRFADYIVRKAPTTVHLYQALYKGVPAACSMTIEHDGQVVGVHWVGTVPEYRGKGLGFAVTHQGLIDAKKRGLSKAILFASAMGKPLYEKMGFVTYKECKVYGKADAKPLY
jgi:GNAT superfamily N-acetyltransferase